MEFNYLYGKQAEQFAYVNIPKALIHEEAFSDVSLEAKVLYGLIMERMGMYRKNKWQDEQGRVYVLYPVKEIVIRQIKNVFDSHFILGHLKDVFCRQSVCFMPLGQIIY